MYYIVTTTNSSVSSCVTGHRHMHIHSNHQVLGLYFDMDLCSLPYKKLDTFQRLFLPWSYGHITENFPSYISRRGHFLTSVRAGTGTSIGTRIGTVPTGSWTALLVTGSSKTPFNFTGTRISLTCFGIPIKKGYCPYMYLGQKCSY